MFMAVGSGLVRLTIVLRLSPTIDAVSLISVTTIGAVSLGEKAALQSLKASDWHLEGAFDIFYTHLEELYNKHKAWIKKGGAKEVICREVQLVKPNLLVVGSRGLGPFQRVFVGTVSEFCVKHVECPVITIKRSAEEALKGPVDD